VLGAVDLFAFVLVAFRLEDAEYVELVGRDVVEGGLKALLEREVQRQGAVQEHTLHAVHGFLEKCHRAVVGVLRRVVVAGLGATAQVFLSEETMDEKANGGFSRPFSGG
jgi:hypothetical protein